MSNLHARHITSRVFDLTQLTRLNLSFNRLRKISSDVQYLSKLIVLDVGHNKLDSLPLELREAVHMRELYASHNLIASFSGHIYKLVELERLDLSHNLFTDLPMETGNLELLKELGIFEVGISRLTCLVFLDVSHCLLDTWPAQVQQLETLQELYLSHNHIPSVPDDIADMHSLHTLHLQHNMITELPSGIFNMALKELLVHHNQIAHLPQCESADPICSTSVKKLDLSYNNLQSLDVNLSFFYKLEHLYLQHNQLASMSSDCFSNMGKLLHLDLSHNQLTDLSNSLGAAGHLEEINLSYNQLVEVPNSLMRCSKLRVLQATNNTISNINGKVLTMFTQLEKLELQHNAITVLSSLLFTIKRLVHADLSHNAISDITEGIANWEQLNYFDISYNEVLVIPRGLCFLKELEFLYMHYNHLSSIPKEFVNLINLHKFTVHHNKLTTSPALLLTMPLLLNCNLSDNAIKSHYYQWQITHSQHVDNAQAVFSKQSIYKQLLGLSDNLERDAVSSQRVCSVGDNTADSSKCVVVLMRKLYAHMTSQPADMKITVNEKFGYLEANTQDSTSMSNGNVLTAMAEVVQASRRYQESLQFHMLQRLSLRQMNKSHRWGAVYLPSPEEFQASIDHCVAHGSVALLNVLPLGTELLDRVSECCEILEHLQQHMLASELQYLLKCQSGQLHCANDYDEIIVAGGADGLVQPAGSVRAQSPAVSQRNRSNKPDPAAASYKQGGFSLFKKKEVKAAEKVAVLDVKHSIVKPVTFRDVAFQDVYDLTQSLLQNRSINPWYILRNRQLIPGIGESSLGRGRLFNAPLPCLQVPRHVYCSSYASQSHNNDDSYLWLNFEALLLLAKCLVLHVEHIQRSIRWLERSSQQRFSVLDIAQRASYLIEPHKPPRSAMFGMEDDTPTMAIDYDDLLGDIYTDLTGELKDSQKQQRAQKGTMTNKRAELREQYYAILSTVLPPSGEEEAPADAVVDASSSSLFVSSIPDEPPRSSSTAQMLNAASAGKEKSFEEQLQERVHRLFGHLGYDGQEKQSDPKQLSEFTQDKVSELVGMLMIYRKLLLLWATRCIESTLALLQGQGFDITSDSCLDTEMYQTAPEDEGVTPILQRSQDSVLRIRKQARRCAYYRAKIYQYSGNYAESVKSYRMYIRLSNRVKGGRGRDKGNRVSKDTLLAYAKVLLAMGHYKLAQGMLEKIVWDYIMPNHPRAVNRAPDSRLSTPAARSDEDVLSPIELLPIDEEMALLCKFAALQVQQLVKAKVFSSDQQRLYKVDDNGFMGKRQNWPPLEYQVGRGIGYMAAYTAQLQKEHEQKQEVATILGRREVMQTSANLQKQAEDMILKVNMMLPVR